MKAIPSDTIIEAARKEYAILRSLGPQVRAEMALEMSDYLRSAVEAGVRLRHPDFNEEKVRLEVVRLMIGNKLYGQMLRAIEGRP